MRPNNAFTTPEQRFFFPSGIEAESHKSFELSGLPQVDMLDGEIGYAIIDNPEGEEVAGQTNYRANLWPGSQVKKIITVGVDGDETTFPGKSWLHPDGSDGTDDQKWLDAPIDSYELQEDDLLVLVVDRGDHMSRDAKLRDSIDENEVLLWPAGKKLPYSNGEQEGDDTARDVSYSLQGVITPELKLIGWKNEINRSARYLVDLAVANSSMQNELERAILEASIPREYSLEGMLGTNKAVQAYLEYFESQTGREYTSHQDPGRRYGEFPDMTPEERSRYELVSEALQVSRRLQR
ncbi:MAG TPA: hypothetical protein VFX79_00765 [Candidatus Saccharimonadales bacterium]|nr:hypothetical protein [Candidatus Saccharimonadales bacterium]